MKKAKLTLHQETLRNLTRHTLTQKLLSGQVTTFTQPVQVCDPFSVKTCANRG
jgi:hypothetical protein